MNEPRLESKARDVSRRLVELVMTEPRSSRAVALNPVDSQEAEISSGGGGSESASRKENDGD